MRFTLATVIAALPFFTVAASPPAIQKMGTAIPISKRWRLINDDKTVNLDALKSHVAVTAAKVHDGLGHFEKNTGASHPSVVTRARKRASAGDALIDDSSSLWYGTISVGTPAIDYTVDFDTGSSDLFLPGPNCGSNCDGHTIYNPSSSSTSKDLGKTFLLQYGDGSSVSGEQYSDTVMIAGLTATDQALGAASQFSSGYSISEFPPDGLMGMGFQTISDYNASPVFQSLVSQGQTDEPVFGFKLAVNGSELYLGGTNSALYTGNFSYAPVTYQAYWQVNMDSVDGNGQPILSNIDSIIDTGTTVV
ncbi:aspartic peptidase domain-containing protein, partial [Melanogaster broomeanus]